MFGCEAMTDALIDADIRTARTLPSAWYTELEHFNRLQSAFTGWQFAAHQSEFGTNNVLPVDHYEAITGESVVLLKGEKTACHSNVCTHRGMRCQNSYRPMATSRWTTTPKHNTVDSGS